MFEPGLLKGEAAVITGGGSGLGFAIARRLSELGAATFLIGRRAERLERAAAAIAEAHGDCAFAACDVRDWAAVESAMAAAEERFGRATILINNAAGNFLARTESISPNAFASVVGIVLHGTFHCTLALGRRWIAAGRRGSIVNIVATYGETGSGFVVPSACAKAGVLAMTRSLAVEWARYGVRVNAVAPGPFPTEGAWSRLLPTMDLEERAKAAHPMKRFGRHAELTNLIAYLVSPSAEYINGECVTIDGGARLCGANGFNHLRDAPDSLWEQLAAARKSAATSDR
jgi:NAD(P)-dependent dehydrogenase (short-subunit alcohol dehydrogenase family)